MSVTNVNCTWLQTIEPRPWRVYSTCLWYTECYQKGLGITALMMIPCSEVSYSFISVFINCVSLSPLRDECCFSTAPFIGMNILTTANIWLCYQASLPTYLVKRSHPWIIILYDILSQTATSPPTKRSCQHVLPIYLAGEISFPVLSTGVVIAAWM